jgi:hypothetical protein
VLLESRPAALASGVVTYGFIALSMVLWHCGVGQTLAILKALFGVG